ncbi:MAG: ribonuclease Z [Candidatus Aenigmatarchaeota archaeon]
MGQIEVTFLGTTAGIPTKYRNHAALYVRYQAEREYVCLFDCGEGTQKQIFSAGLNFMRVSDIFITHWHADHFAGLLGMMETMNLEKRQEPLNIYGPEASRFVPILLSLGYGSKQFPIKAINVEHEGTEIQTLVDSDEFSIQAMPMKHGVPAVAYAIVEKDRIKIDKEKAIAMGLPATGPLYKILKEKGIAVFKDKEILVEDVSFFEPGKKVVYSGDTKPNKNMVEFAKNAALLIHDSTFFSHGDFVWKHAVVDEVVKIAEQAHVKKLILTHISRRYADINELEKKAKEFPNTEIAKDFMRVVV